MSDLTEILKMQWEAYPNALKTGQEAQASAIALGNARRAQQERMDLKALFAKQPNPSFQAVGAIDPAFAIEQQKAQMQLHKEQIENKYKETQTGEIEAKRKEEIEKLRIGEAVAVVNQYDQDIESGMPEPQALAKYNDASGQALSMLKQGGMIPPDFPAFDPKVMNPEAVRLAGEGRGFYTEKVKQRQEYQKSLQSTAGTYAAGLGPQKYIWNDQLQRFERPPSSPAPGLSNGPAPTQELQVEPGAVDPMENYLSIINNPNTPPEVRAFATEKAQSLMPKINAPQATSEQNLERIVKQAAEKEAAIITAKQQAEEQQTINKSLKAYETLPDINHIRDLIKGSIGSDLEYWSNRLGRTIGQSLAAGDFQAALAVVASDMASSVAFAPGSQSDKELAQKLKQVGNLDANMTMDEKMAAVDEWFQGRQRHIGKYGKYSDAELIDLGREGKITHETALKVRANRNKGQ